MEWDIFHDVVDFPCLDMVYHDAVVIHQREVGWSETNR